MRWRRCVLTRYSSGLFSTRSGSSGLFATRSGSSWCFVPHNGSASSVSLTGWCGWTSCQLSESARCTHTDCVVPRCRGSGCSHTDGVIHWLGCSGCSHTNGGAWCMEALSRGCGWRRCGQGTLIVDGRRLRPGRRPIHVQPVIVPSIEPGVVGHVTRHAQIIIIHQVVEHVTRHAPLLSSPTLLAYELDPQSGVDYMLSRSLLSILKLMTSHEPFLF